MDTIYILQDFFTAIRDDPRIGPTHISLYTTLFHQWSRQEFQGPVRVFSKELMPLCKIYGSATFYRSIRELNEYGLIQYKPCNNYIKGSYVYFNKKDRNDSILKW
jgi:hypothetical protein